MFILICISADFDPVHKGHEKLIREAKKIADSESKKLVVYQHIAISQKAFEEAVHLRTQRMLFVKFVFIL